MFSLTEDRYRPVRPLVYVIDDDERVRQSTGSLLGAIGYRTRAWGDAKSFLRAAKSLEPACVLIDLNLPGFSGLQLQEELRRKDTYLPLIFMTGAGDIGSAVTAMRRGAVDFLEKPFTTAELERAIDEGIAHLSVRGSAPGTARAREKISRLSKRETEVLKGLTNGLPNKTIAFDLGVSPRTIEVHRASIMRKFDVNSFAQALRIAFEAGY